MREIDLPCSKSIQPEEEAAAPNATPGFGTICSIPLKSTLGTVCGVLQVAHVEEDAFTHSDEQVFCTISIQMETLLDRAGFFPSRPLPNLSPSPPTPSLSLSSNAD